MTTQVKNFTTTLPTQVLQAIEIAAKDLSIPKNEVLIRAFEKWNRARKQALVARSYSKAKEDVDLKEISEEGLSDYSKNLEAWEK